MVCFDFVRKTFVGDVLVAATPKGVCAVVFGKKDDAQLLSSMRATLPHEVLRHDPRSMRPYTREIRDYFGGRLKRFTQPVDLVAVNGPFQRKVLKRLARLPYGRLISYGELAARAGSPRAARAVGAAMARNPVPIVIPCHRVVARNGLGGFGCGVSRKKRLLAHEGVIPPDLPR